MARRHRSRPTSRSRVLVRGAVLPHQNDRRLDRCLHVWDVRDAPQVVRYRSSWDCRYRSHLSGRSRRPPSCHPSDSARWEFARGVQHRSPLRPTVAAGPATVGEAVHTDDGTLVLDRTEQRTAGSDELSNRRRRTDWRNSRGSPWSGPLAVRDHHRLPLPVRARSRSAWPSSSRSPRRPGCAPASRLYLRATKFWGKIFLINFAIGVVTGIVQEFQFGMNWSSYSRFVGDVFGAPLAMEALLAFFLESTFLGSVDLRLGQAVARACTPPASGWCRSAR